MCYNEVSMSKKQTASVNTREQIVAKFTELLTKQPISQIGVRDIAEACGINRNTFYYYYKNIPDLIESVVKESVDEIFTNHPPTYESLEDCFVAAIDFARERRQLVYNIYNSTNRAIFERYLWKICEYTIESYINSLPPVEGPLNLEEVAIIRDFLKYEFFGFVIDWINHGMPDNAMEKVRVLSSIIKNGWLAPRKTPYLANRGEA